MKGKEAIRPFETPGSDEPEVESGVVLEYVKDKPLDYVVGAIALHSIEHPSACLSGDHGAIIYFPKQDEEIRQKLPQNYGASQVDDFTGLSDLAGGL